MSVEPTSFLYPFIGADERDAEALVADLLVTTRAKMLESAALRADTLERCAEQVERAGAAMAERFARGGRLFSFGNGGSATDAQATADLFRHPPHGRPLPALSLVDDQAVLTALSNDVGFELVFSRQLIAHAREVDIAIGFSTSGASANVLHAFDEARRRGLLTVGLCGYEGSGMATSTSVQHCLVVHSESVHRIQEAQEALTLAVWGSAQGHLAAAAAAAAADAPGSAP
ncbi:MAG: SIS domain-containing protein [Acidimicrobiales bacterium]